MDKILYENFRKIYTRKYNSSMDLYDIISLEFQFRDKTKERRERENLRLLDSSVSNIIPNLIPIDTGVYASLLYLSSGTINSDGHALSR